MGALENYYAYKNPGYCLLGRLTPSPREGGDPSTPWRSPIVMMGPLGPAK